MKTLLLPLIAGALLLSACQPSNDAVNATSKEQKAESALVESKAAGNDFSLLVDQPYDVIESDETCEEPIVIEFFAYQCPHCYKLQEHLLAWKEKNQGKVKFKAIPTHLGHQEFSSFLIVHQAAVQLGILEKAMPKMFTRLHEEKKGFASQDEVVSFFTSLGVAEDRARATIQDGKTIQGEIDKGFEMLAKYKISGVPTILVNYKYQFNVTKAGGYDKVFDIVDETLKLPSSCSTK